MVAARSDTNVCSANARSSREIPDGGGIVATFDQRHFRVVTALDGKPFTLLPAGGA
jgi:hypothetical protein